jgi:excisionase family DNA binding protein
MGRLISLAELAVRTGMCESTWRKKVARGEVPVIRIGRSVRVDEAVVQLIVQCGVRSKSHTAPDVHQQAIRP